MISGSKQAKRRKEGRERGKKEGREGGRKEGRKKERKAPLILKREILLQNETHSFATRSINFQHLGHYF